jgi:predicted membrane protein
MRLISWTLQSGSEQKDLNIKKKLSLCFYWDFSSYATYTKGFPIHHFPIKTASIHTTYCRLIIYTYCFLKLSDQSESVFYLFLVTYWFIVLLMLVSYSEE